MYMQRELVRIWVFCCVSYHKFSNLQTIVCGRVLVLGHSGVIASGHHVSILYISRYCSSYINFEINTDFSPLT